MTQIPRFSRPDSDHFPRRRASLPSAPSGNAAGASGQAVHAGHRYAPSTPRYVFPASNSASTEARSATICQVSSDAVIAFPVLAKRHLPPRFATPRCLRCPSAACGYASGHPEDPNGSRHNLRVAMARPSVRRWHQTCDQRQRYRCAMPTARRETRHGYVIRQITLLCPGSPRQPERHEWYPRPPGSSREMGRNAASNSYTERLRCPGMFRPTIASSETPSDTLINARRLFPCAAINNRGRQYLWHDHRFPVGHHAQPYPSGIRSAREACRRQLRIWGSSAAIRSSPSSSARRRRVIRAAPDQRPAHRHT